MTMMLSCFGLLSLFAELATLARARVCAIVVWIRQERFVRNEQ